MDDCYIRDDGIASTKASLSRMDSSLAFFVKGFKEKLFKDLAEHVDNRDWTKVVSIVSLLRIFT